MLSNRLPPKEDLILVSKQRLWNIVEERRSRLLVKRAVLAPIHRDLHGDPQSDEGQREPSQISDKTCRKISFQGLVYQLLSFVLTHLRIALKYAFGFDFGVDVFDFDPPRRRPILAVLSLYAVAGADLGWSSMPEAVWA